MKNIKIYKKQIIDMLSKRGNISFIELSRIDGFSGKYDFGYDSHNIFFWFGMSAQFIDALEVLIKDKIIEWKSTNLLVYMYDGTIPNIPTAKQCRKYKTPRWLPIVFNRGPNYGK